MKPADAKTPDSKSAPQGERTARDGRRKKGRAPRATAAERRARIGILVAKAQAAACSARMLSEAGDTDGVVNRTYYAVFGAARAALATVRYAQATSKQHGTIYRRFDKLFVQQLAFDPSFGRRFFDKLASARNKADYGKNLTDVVAAQAALGEMERFLAAVDPILTKAKP